MSNKLYLGALQFMAIVFWKKWKLWLLFYFLSPFFLIRANTFQLAKKCTQPCITKLIFNCFSDAGRDKIGMRLYFFSLFLSSNFAGTNYVFFFVYLIWGLIKFQNPQNYPSFSKKTVKLKIVSTKSEFPNN